MTKLQTQAEQNKSNTLIFSTNMYQFVPTLVTLFWFFKMGNQLDTQSGYILIHFDTCKNKKKRANTRVYTFWYSLKLSFSGERGTLTAYANTLIINQLCQSVTRQRHELQNDFWQGTLMPKTLLQRFEFRKNPEPTQQFF